jgi:hypothetical protein
MFPSVLREAIRAASGLTLLRRASSGHARDGQPEAGLDNALPAASERLTSHNTWPVSLVRNGIACHPGQPFRTNSSTALNPIASR